MMQGLIVCGVIFYQMPTMGQYAYPAWAVGLGWLISLFPILLLPLYAIYYMCRHGGLQVGTRDLVVALGDVNDIAVSRCL